MSTQTHNRTVVRVPDVAGHALAKAKILLEAAGLGGATILFRESYEDRDTVLEQRPARGQMVHAGSEVTLWVARRGYLEHLPAIYRRSDAVGRNIVRDICFLFEHMFGSIEDLLAVGDTFYDPHTCPPEFLGWLAQWTAFLIDHDWPEDKQRALVKRAVDLYRIRGTKRGLALFLQLFSGYEPEITENEWPFRGFRVDTDARIGLDSVVLPPVDLSRCFIVTMPIRFDQVTPEQIILIHKIITMEKPAHAQYYLRFAEEEGDVELREFFSIGLRSGIGIGAEVVEDSDAVSAEGEAEHTDVTSEPGAEPAEGGTPSKVKSSKRASKRGNT